MSTNTASAVSEMTMTIESITPETAQHYLSMSAGNRTIRKHRIARYQRDLLAGRWHMTHQGVAFDCAGKLRDGHHRLTMVINTGIGIRVPVFRNVPFDGLAYIDSGLARSTRDALSMADKGIVSNAATSVARNFTNFPQIDRTIDLSADELLAALDAYSEQIKFAMSALGESAGYGITRSVRVLVARASQYVDHDRLREFCDVLKTGNVRDPKADAAAVVFRNILLRASRGTTSGAEEERYQKCQMALQYFVKRQPITKLYGTEEDLFPVIG